MAKLTVKFLADELEQRRVTVLVLPARHVEGAAVVERAGVDL